MNFGLPSENKYINQLETQEIIPRNAIGRGLGQQAVTATLLVETWRKPDDTEETTKNWSISPRRSQPWIQISNFAVDVYLAVFSLCCSLRRFQGLE